MYAMRYYTYQLSDLSYKYGPYHLNTLSMYRLVRVLKNKNK